MAYTYNDFLNAANGSGVMNRFSQDDLTVAQKNPEYGLSMVSLMKDLDGATTAEQRLLATEAANQLRKNYGVYNAGGGYAGSHGSAIGDLQNQLQNYGSFNYANQGQLNQLQEQLQNYSPFQYGNETVYQQLLDAVANQQPFSYDQTKDPSYSALKKTYLREGERAGANAMAQAAAASGGQVSSYAAQAAQQANNYYAGQLADIIPTLEQNAYQRHLSDIQSRLSSLGVLQNDRNQAQQEWLNHYNLLQNNLSNLQNDRVQAQEDWLNGYNILQNNLQNLQQQDATDYQRYLQQVEQALAQQQYEDQQAQQKYENALALYNLLGYATPEVAEILGLNSGIANTGTEAGIQLGENPNPDVTDGEGNETELSGDQIKKLQRLLGLPDDGVWGKDSEAAAKAMWGSTSLDDAWSSYQNMQAGAKQGTLSDNARRFMQTLPYAYGGADRATWNKVVDERLDAAYSNGTLSESDVVAIMTQLGLYNVEGEEEQPAEKNNTQNKTTQTSKKPVTVRAPGSAAAVNNRFNSVY